MPNQDPDSSVSIKDDIFAFLSAVFAGDAVLFMVLPFDSSSTQNDWVDPIMFFGVVGVVIACLSLIPCLVLHRVAKRFQLSNLVWYLAFSIFISIFDFSVVTFLMSGITWYTDDAIQAPVNLGFWSGKVYLLPATLASGFVYWLMAGRDTRSDDKN